MYDDPLVGLNSKLLTSSFKTSLKYHPLPLELYSSISDKIFSKTFFY